MMQSYQYYIDDIQSAVYSPETADPDFLRDAAAQYAEACAEANQRLRQVGQLLRRGLRSEALQLTEEEPNLLDFVGMLDFPELPTWLDLLRQWGMAPPPALLIDLAADINQAYAEHAPLESLLKQHRLLAMSRAPLAGRVRTLRQIRRADPANVAWEEDVKILETARIKQMDREIDTAFRRDDLVALTAVKGELDDDGWMISKPNSLQNKLNRSYKDLSLKLARAELERLERPLNAAHMSFDVAQGFQVRERWIAAAKTAELNPDEPLAERAAPALEWLATEEQLQTERKKRQRAIAAVEEALEDSTPTDELGRLYEATLVFDEPIPPVLKHRVEQRMTAHTLATQRRHRILLTLIVAAVVLVGTSIAYVIVQQQHRATVAGVVDTLKAMIDQGRLQEAQAFYTQATAAAPVVATDSDVQEQKSRIADAVDAERGRRDNFANALARASAAPATDPDQNALSEARDLAQTSEEKQGVADIEAKIAAAERHIQDEHDAAISQGLAAFRQRLKAIESADRANLNETNTKLSELATDIESTRSKFAKANAAMLAQLDPLAARINAIRQSIEQQNQKADARALITSSIGKPAAYDTAMEDFAKRFPESEIAANLAVLKQESHLWKGFAEWSDFASTLFSENEELTSKKAREFIAKGDQLDKTYANVQLAEFYRARKAYLDSIASREPEDGTPLKADLQKLFRDPLVGNLWMVEAHNSDNDILRYYSLHEPVRENGAVRFNYLVGFDLGEKPQNVRDADVTYVGRAPQSNVAERATTLLTDMPQRDWEKNITTILDAILKEDRLDPILKIALLQRVLKTGAAGSSALADGFAAYRRDLEGATWTSRLAG